MNTNSVFKNISLNLAARASAMNSNKQQHALLNSVASLTYEPNMPEDIGMKMRAAIQNGREKARRQLRAEAKFNAIPLSQQMSALSDAPLTEKRKLLDALPIINVPFGAAFLGVAEADLHDLNSQNGGLFGDIYLRRHCNSMNELLLIAQNPGWLRYRPDGAPALALPDSEMLYAMTFVDISTAMGYTNMTPRELQMHAQDIYRFHRCNFTYRVSDLEEIRVAKLKAQKQ